MLREGKAETSLRRRDRTRWDVQGLRAFAVLSVVAFHLWPARLPGGFVGVDVFFVISGFLITGHLVRDLENNGRIRLATFWSRRAKRLLPSAFLTLVATGAAVLLIAPSSLWAQYAHELMASTVYLQNWQLAADSVNYLASSNRPSPFQHFWSLSVEEQFYIALPLLLLLVVRLRRLGSGRLSARAGVRILLVVVLVVSFAWCVWQTRSAPGIAYFSTATRAWEFAAGGLMSTIVARRATRPATRLIVAGGAWLGAALLVVSVFVITPATAFPGAAAALPVSGAALVVLLGGQSRLTTLGAIPPIAFVGRISYSVYLWHWPAVVLVPLVTRHELTTRDKVAILVFALALASATTLLVEEPFRFSSRVASLRPRRVALLGVVSSAVVVLLGVGSLTGLHVQQVQAKALASTLASGQARCFGAAAAISAPKPCVNPRLADVVVPAPETALQDDANRPACWSHSSGDFNVCSLGPKTGYTKHLLAVGDSHNNVLVATYEAIAKKHDWRIDVAGHAGCYWTTARQVEASAADDASCSEWKSNATRFVESHPDLSAVIVTHSTTNSPVVAPAGQNRATVVSGLVGAWRAATDNGVPIIALRDNPHARDDVVDCVAQATGPTASACDQPRAAALADFDGSTEALATVKLGREIDLSDLYCTSTTCPAVMGGVLVYRDPTHLTATFALTLAPYLGQRLAKALTSLDR